MKCPVCDHELIEPLPSICPHCGADLSLNASLRQLCRDVKRNYRLWLSGVIVLLVAIILLLIFRAPSPCPPLAQGNDSLTLLKGQIAVLHDSLAWYRDKFASLPSNVEKVAGEYVVQTGDNLWLIAQKLLGDGNLYPKIASDNQISDPSLIRVGQKIVVKK